MHDKEIRLLNKKAEQYSSRLDKIIGELKNVIVGQEHILERILISLLADGHVLLEGMPGLAKTLMVSTLSSTINSGFHRIQFTPDLLPADIVGTKIYNHNNGTFSTKKGPVFTNFILADEINRAPPKVQSALLEAMQERQVTISGDTYPLARPFLVLATQNPIETEGTYRLPEAQVDRFMFKLLVDYPDHGQEKEIINRMTVGSNPSAKNIMNSSEVLEMQKFCTGIYADPNIVDYAASLVHATRKPNEFGLDMNGLIEYGASPRASIWLILGGKAHALLNGRGYVKPEDVKAIAPDVLRHRIMLTYEAEAEDVTTEQIIDKIIKAVRIP